MWLTWREATERALYGTDPVVSAVGATVTPLPHLGAGLVRVPLKNYDRGL